MIKFGNINDPAPGTVTNFSAGDAPPLFTTSVANPGTTPALSFTRPVEGANLFYAGPPSGAALAPTFRHIDFADLPGAIVKTVAQMLALQAVSGFIPGALYNVPDAYSNTLNLYIRAITTTDLEANGTGDIFGINMSAAVRVFVTYTLSTDFVGSCYNPVLNIYAADLNSLPVSIPYIDWGNTLGRDFSNSFFYGSNLANVNLGAAVIANSYVHSSTFLGLAPIKFLSCSFHNCNVQFNPTTQLQTLETVQMDVGSSLILGSVVFDQINTLSRCRIGVGKVIDTSQFGMGGYTANSAITDGQINTFTVISADLPEVNPDIGQTVDFLKFSTMGVVVMDDGTNSWVHAQNYAFDHVYTILATTPITIVDLAIGDNIELMVTGSTIITNSANGDFLTFKNDPNNALKFQSIIQRIRT